MFQETWDPNNNAWKEGSSLEPFGEWTRSGYPSLLRLKSGTLLQEDTRIKIKVTRANNPSADLDVRLTVQVRPNPAVVVQADPLILDHNTAPKLTLTGFQPSVTYAFIADLASADYHTINVNGDLRIANGKAAKSSCNLQSELPTGMIQPAF